jgi:beta-lysine 5,6-aminomutase alpha subunit
MKSSKINLDFGLVEKARKNAAEIADEVQLYIEKHTTVAVERSVARLLGVDGVNEEGVPLPNLLVDQLKQHRALSMGAAFYLGNAILVYQKEPAEIVAMIAEQGLDITNLPLHDRAEINKVIRDKALKSIAKIRQNKQWREDFFKRNPDKDGPLLYVIVATGNIYEDIVQARAAAQQGADVIAVIRTTGQSLLDYVPFGATTDGFGGTYATQENFRLMRAALDEESQALGRYIRLCNYCSGLCMPEIAAMGALERLDVMLNDALYGILFRDINMKRTMVDQYFSRLINGFAGIIINTGEDNYLTTSDAYDEADTVLASQFINEQLALNANIPEEQMGLGHAFEIDPEMENGFLYELAQAQMAREIFPKAPLKYMPPTKFMTGNIFRGHVQDALFNAVTVMTGQRIHLLGMLTEAIHTPFMSDRYLSIENARYINTTMKDLGSEISFKTGGLIENRAREVLKDANTLLSKIKKDGLFNALESGVFAQTRRYADGGKGLDGVIEKDPAYMNPFISLFTGRQES